MGRDDYRVLVLSQKFSGVEEKKAFLTLFALRFPGLVEYFKEDSESQGTPDYLRVEFELGSYQVRAEIRHAMNAI